MSTKQKRIHSVVRRDLAENYLLISLVACVVTVISVRIFLQLTGFPQIGDDVLHFAHALWGGLLLFAAAILPLAFANRWVLKISALLSGIGIGLFIDEVGKFITQTNDYFFPPALSIIYGFILLGVFEYLYFKRPYQKDPRTAMYHALEELHEALDSDLDVEEAAQIETHLVLAKQSDKEEIVSLANSIASYLQKEKHRLLAAKHSLWKRSVISIDKFGIRLGRHVYRNIISGLLILWLAFVIGYITSLALANTNLDSQVLQWRGALIGIQSVVGVLMIIAIFFWLTRNEKLGLKFAVTGFLLSLVALQLLHFYISQFSAITSTLLQLILLVILLAYRRWYLTFVA